MQKGLISIITPCYNTGRILHRLMDSILLQDYPSVEMFAIDDGSSDNTAEVIKSYIIKFKEKGYSLRYIRQTNGGQSSALNNGLKFVHGEYLIWPDSDDYFRNSYALSSFVNALACHDESFGVVRCVPTYIEEDTLKERNRINLTEQYLSTYQFENCLYSTNFFWGAGDYMIKMDAFDKVNPSREIYVEKNAGQNWQMLLTVLYSYKCITLSESLFNVLERSDSHCRGQYKTYEQQVAKYNSYRNTIVNTLHSISTMSDEKRKIYISEVEKKYKIINLELAIRFNRSKDEMRLKKELSEIDWHISKKREAIIRLNRYIIGKVILKVYSIFTND